MNSQWQPIETAPMNTPILVTDGKVIVVVECELVCGKPFLAGVGFGGYEWDFDFEWKDLTHWMPQPNMPNRDTSE